MSDSLFAVRVFLTSILLSALCGAFATFLFLSGTHECQVEIQHTGHTAVYLTQCTIGAKQ